MVWRGLRIETRAVKGPFKENSASFAHYTGFSCSLGGSHCKNKQMNKYTQTKKVSSKQTQMPFLI